MSLVFGTREVSVGPTVGFHGDVHSQSTKTTSIVDHVNELSNNLKSSSSNSFINGGELKDQDYKTKISCFSVDPDLGSYSDSSSIDDVESSRSSTDDEVGEEDETEIQSKFKSSLCSLESLEDSLPIKRGLSNFFTGKSKSFANLSEATTVRSLGKIENPFNKRRRTLIACKRRRRSRTFYTSSVNPVSMPLLTLNEEQSDQDDEEQSDVDHESDKNNNNIKEEEDNVYLSKKHESRKIKSYKPTRCFSLTDFHHHNHHL